MPKKNGSDSPAGGVYGRMINLFINNFTGQGYNRLPLIPASGSSPKSNFRTNAPGQEVAIDFRHIEVPENTISHRRSQATSDALINNRQKSSHEIKVKPGGIQRNEPRLIIRVEEGRTEVAKEEEDHEIEENKSITNQEAEEFLRSRKEAMIRKYSTPKHL